MEFDLAPLRKLQEFDLRIKDYLQREDEFPQRLEAVDREIGSRQLEMEGEKSKLTELQKGRKDAESEVEALRSKIAHYKDQLLGVKTNKEYSALLKEIEAAQKKIDGIEETIIGYMIETDEHNLRLKKLEAWFQSEKKKLLEERSSIDAELARTRADRSECEAQRLEIEALLDETVRNTYLRVRQLRGTALAEARDQFCMECHVRLRPQVYNDIRDNDRLITCDSCYRILYYDGPPPPPQTEEEPPQAEGEEAEAIHGSRPGSTSSHD